MRAKMRRLRLGAVFCTFLVLFCSLYVPIYAEEEETAAEKYERLKEELEQISEAIDLAKEDKAAAEELRAQLQKEKQVVDQLIAINKQEIAKTETELALKEEEVALKRAAIYENDQLFQQRLVAIYKMNDSSVLSQLLTVDNFSELFQAIDALQRISQHDSDLLALLQRQRSELEVEQAKIDAMLLSLENTYADLAYNTNVLAGNIVAQDARITAAEAEVQAQEEAYEETHEALEQAQQEMAAIASQVSASGTVQGDGSIYVGGTFIWPVPGFYTITCHFGSPDPNGSPHRGLDVSGGNVLGAPIVACGSGTVTTAAFAHYSYGNYVVLDHGNGVKTLYAHCSTLNVSVGQFVNQGEPIATVGSTGFSTGPHLHLEVHDGGLQNPLNYLRG